MNGLGLILLGQTLVSRWRKSRLLLCCSLPRKSDPCRDRCPSCSKRWDELIQYLSNINKWCFCSAWKSHTAIVAECSSHGVWESRPVVIAECRRRGLWWAEIVVQWCSGFSACRSWFCTPHCSWCRNIVYHSFTFLAFLAFSTFSAFLAILIMFVFTTSTLIFWWLAYSNSSHKMHRCLRVLLYRVEKQRRSAAKAHQLPNFLLHGKMGAHIFLEFPKN